MAKEVTMRDIAEKVGVSTVTVSKALTNKDGVGSELRQMIKNIANQMGYHYQTSAKVGKDNFSIGVIVEEHYVGGGSYPFYLKMYQSVVLQLCKVGYSGILEVLRPDMLENGILPNSIIDRKVDGIIVLGKVKSEYLRLIRETNFPIVYLDFYERNMEVPSVITDNMYGCYMTTSYLIGMGHRSIAFVGKIQATPSILDRYLGYYRALLVHGIEQNNDYIIPDRGEDGLFTELILPKEMPTAFVCNCDEIAYILIDMLKALGYRVPEDISVVGFDNYSFTEYSTPKLTTIEVNIEAMTETAVDLLIRMMKGEKGIYGRKVISGKLIIRDSVSKRES